MPRARFRCGLRPPDDYRLTKAGFYDHLDRVFLGWYEHPEVVSGNWPATLEEALGVPLTHEYPLSEQSAVDSTTYFIDVYAPSRSPNNRRF